MDEFKQDLEEAPAPPPPNRVNLITGILFSFLLFLSVIVFYGVIIRQFHMPLVYAYFIGRCVFWACLAILFIYVAKFEKQPFFLWKERKYPFEFYLVSFLGLITTIFLGSIIISLIIKLTGASTTSQRLTQVVQLMKYNIPLLIFTCLTAGVVEEFVFRGYLMPRLQLLVNKPWLVFIISSALFGLLHFGYGTVGNVIVPFFIGIVLAIHYYYYRNIRILIFCHFMWDFMILMLTVSFQKAV